MKLSWHQETAILSSLFSHSSIPVFLLLLPINTQQSSCWIEQSLNSFDFQRGQKTRKKIDLQKRKNRKQTKKRNKSVCPFLQHCLSCSASSDWLGLDCTLHQKQNKKDHKPQKNRNIRVSTPSHNKNNNSKSTWNPKLTKQLAVEFNVSDHKNWEIKTKNIFFNNLFSPTNTKNCSICFDFYLSLCYLLCFFVFDCGRASNSNTTKIIFHSPDFGPFSFACFCNACLIPDKRQQTKHQTAVTRDNSRATTNHIFLWKYGLKKFHQIFHLKIFVVFFICINKNLKNIRHNHMTKRDVLKTIGAKKNWWQRLFLAKKTQNCWKRFTSFLSDVGLSYQPNYAHDQGYFEVPFDFDELTKDETNLVLVVSLLRFEDYKTLQGFESDFQILARRVELFNVAEIPGEVLWIKPFYSFSKIEKCICLMLADLDQFSQFREFQIRYPKITDVSCLGSVPDLDLRVVNELLMWVEWEMFTNWICLVVVEVVIFQNWLGLFLVWFDELTEFFLELMLMLWGFALSKFFLVFLWLFQMCFLFFCFFLFFVLDLSVQNTTNSFFKNRFDSVFFIDQWKEK